MKTDNPIARQLFERKYPYQMPYLSYLRLVEKGLDLLRQTAKPISAFAEFCDLQAIRLALEWRIEMIAQKRKNQWNAIGFSKINAA
ncbi:MAG: hypothetical protein JSS78_03445 [Bacteroidetes bacterium]|nr:hypothetical protein [Bacteroidota bacterium]